MGAVIKGNIPSGENSRRSAQTNFKRLINWFDRTGIVPIFVILLLSYVLYELCFSTFKISEAGYRREIFGLEIFDHYDNYYSFFPILVILLGHYRRLSWASLDRGKYLRPFVALLAMIMAWKFSCYDYNFYLDQPHYLDRFLIFALGILIWFHPIFAMPFLAFLFFVIRQFELPLDLYSWTDKLTPIGILIMFLAYLLYNTFHKVSAHVFVLLSLCMAASHVMVPGIAKAKIGPGWYTWMFENRLDNLLVSSYVNGWMWFADQETVLWLADLFARGSVPLQIFTMLVELCPVFVLICRPFSIAVLLGFTMLHAGIFISSGIFFWKWIVTDIGLIALLLFADRELLQRLYNRTTFLVSAGVIIIGFSLFNTVWLGWFDSRVSHIYKIEAVGVSGEVYEVGRDFFKPYDLTFAQNRFHFLTEAPVVARTFGAVFSYDTFIGYQQDPAGTLKTMIDEKPRELRPKMIESFDNFVKTFFGNLNRAGKRDFWLATFAAPFHIFARGHGRLYDMQEPVREVQIRLQQSYFDQNEIHYVTDKVIRKIEIPNWQDWPS